VLDIRPVTGDRPSDDEAWREVGMSRLEEEWDNPEDAICDNWRKLYGMFALPRSSVNP
jgi:hypothetical protein